MKAHTDERDRRPGAKLMPGGFYQWEVPNVRDAIQLAERLRDRGAYRFFRGQRDATWPVTSSFARLDEVGRQEAQRKIVDFERWVRSAPAMVPYLQNDDAIIAAAQHHGVCQTTFIDFSREPTVAAWFATDGALDGHSGAIYMVDPEEVSDLFATLTESGPTVRFLEVDVDNLWRLQAQHGLFLEAQTNVERVWPFDRIVFPQVLDICVIDRRRVYPDRRSHLEQMIDHYRLLRNFEGNSRTFWENNPHISHIYVDDDENGADVTHVKAEASSNESPRESWNSIDIDSTPPSLTTKDLLTKTRPLSDVVKLRRTCADLALITDSLERRNGSLQSLLDQLWEGVRPHHYTEDQIVSSISALSRFHEVLGDLRLTEGDQLRRAAARLLLAPLEIEMGLAGGGSTRAWVSAASLSSAITPARRVHTGLAAGTVTPSELGNLFDKLRGRTLSLFDPSALRELFAQEIVPWQISVCRPLIAFWPDHIVSLGRP